MCVYVMCVACNVPVRRCVYYVICVYYVMCMCVYVVCMDVYVMCVWHVYAMWGVYI